MSLRWVGNVSGRGLLFWSNPAVWELEASSGFNAALLSCCATWVCWGVGAAGGCGLETAAGGGIGAGLVCCDSTGAGLGPVMINTAARTATKATPARAMIILRTRLKRQTAGGHIGNTSRIDGKGFQDHFRGFGNQAARWTDSSSLSMVFASGKRLVLSI